jgi:hypothetical protein
MTPTAREDLTLPLIPERSHNNRGPSPAAAFVPIAIAVVGVFIVLLGGISVRAIDAQGGSAVQARSVDARPAASGPFGLY